MYLGTTEGYEKVMGEVPLFAPPSSKAQCVLPQNETCSKDLSLPYKQKYTKDIPVLHIFELFDILCIRYLSNI